MELDKSGKKLTDLGAGRANDCWYLSVEAALKEFDVSFGSPQEFRKKLAQYGRESVLPRYDASETGRDHVLKALQRIEGGCMAESAEIKWTANLIGFLVFLFSEQYCNSSGGAGTSHALWSVGVPQGMEALLRHACRKRKGSFSFCTQMGTITTRLT